MIKHKGKLRPSKENVFPVSVFPFSVKTGNDDPISNNEDKESDLWVVVSPFLDGAGRSSLKLENSKGIVESISFSYQTIKWESRFNWRVRRRFCEEIVETAKRFCIDSAKIEVLRFLPKDNDSIWRIRADRLKEMASDIAFKVIDGSSLEVSFRLYPFEMQERTLEDGTRIECSFYSLEVSRDLRCFSIEGIDPSKSSSLGFAAIDGRLYNNLERIYWDWTRNAGDDDKRYRRWYAEHRASKEELDEQTKATFPTMPLVSVVVPCFDSSELFLKECVASVVAQSYGNWELLLVDGSADGSSTVSKVAESFNDKRIRYIALPENLGIVGNTNMGIKEACGEWVAFLDHDDKLAPDALFCYVCAINENSNISALYCDEDSFTHGDNFRWPFFKTTALNQDLLYAHNCVTHFLAVKKSVIEEIGLSPDDVAGAQDYDLTLRVLAAGGRIHHVTRVLYHWRMHEGSTAGDNIDSKPYAQTAGRLALQRHFDQRGIAGRVEDTEHPFVYRMRYELHDPLPLVSVIIPNKDHIGELDACIRSIMEKSAYRNFEIIVVENNSEDEETFAYYERIQGECSQVLVIRWDGGFNYSAIINYGVQHSRGDRLLLLNNDTEVISPDFMTEMLGYLERPEVGVVGAKLYFRDELVQHAGIEIGPFDSIVHVNQDFPREREGYGGRAVRPGNFSAVTGACQMVRRDVFEQVGGYDEAFAVGFNDADFCMRAYEAGYLTVFTPYAELYHYEFTSRGRETADAAKLVRWEHERDLFHERWRKYFTEGDPFSNPNLSLKSAYYALPE
ncbi:MAG: glycosyltransferase family 2 protein [Eggerthellaceae bacterium]|nr:glycosyltransferase family 2 protein [Eggerthellaceae bacterium]